LCIDQAIDVAAIAVRMGDEIEKALDVRERNIQRAAMADEGQGFDVRRSIGAITVVLAGGGWQQSDFFVVPDGLNVDSGGFAQFANAHGGFPFVNEMLDLGVDPGCEMFPQSIEGKTMSACQCHSACSETPVNPRFRRALWVALVINAAMFAVEIVGGVKSGSVSLFADAVDFAGDAANYGISLTVLSLGLIWRARAALVKGLTMGAFGVFVLGRAAWGAMEGIPPEPLVMGGIGLLALAANGFVALLLYTFRDGDANMRSVWLCSRNDAIGNVAVMAAAAGVFGTGAGWPDLVVASIMAGLALSAGVAVVRQARRELDGTPGVVPQART